MKRRAAVLTLIAILVLLATAYLWGPSSVPQGQKPLLALSNANFGDFESAFDADPDAPRLVLLLSPT
jgi:hypothetical protein